MNARRTRNHRLPRALLLLWGLTSVAALRAQVSAGLWDAYWIAHPDADASAYGVYHFRRGLQLGEVPERLTVHVSGDNRYVLYVNGARVGDGPARGDLLHWRYETYDVAPYLRAGRNTVAAVVWNFGAHKPLAQISSATGFVLQAEGRFGDSLNTDTSWEVLRNPAYAPELTGYAIPNTYLVVGPGDIVDGDRYPWGWETAADTVAAAWLPAEIGQQAKGYGRGTDGGRFLTPREVPHMRRLARDFGNLLDPETGEVVEVDTDTYLIPPNDQRSYLFRLPSLDVGYPELITRAGRGARVELTYAEAMVDERGQKGQRDEVVGRRIVGYKDVFLPDGGDRRRFEPLWWRTWRYLQIDIETAGDSLELLALNRSALRYPWRDSGYVRSSDSSLDAIQEVGWRTAERCASETYMDCPYYEQIQYAGDTRIQALISLYNTGDDRLMRRAISDFDDSRLSNGLTQSRYPADATQYIPPFSLLWVSMVYDYWMHRPDSAFVRQFLPGVEQVLAWHADRVNEAGLLGRTPWWNFVDWAEAWPWDSSLREGGVPPQGEEGNSAVLTLQYAYALGHAEALMAGFGESRLAERYGLRRGALNAAVMRACYDTARGLVADLPGGASFSQHANAMAALSGAVRGEAAKTLVGELLADTSLTRATMYYKFYLFEAMEKVGLGERYVGELAPWTRMLELGLTTFAEQPEPTRSDCHAWSASPSYHLYSLVAGIKPAAPGWRSVRIVPRLGSLDSLAVDIPHPRGHIIANYARTGSGIEARIELPDGLPGTLVWKEDVYNLQAGSQTLRLE